MTMKTNQRGFAGVIAIIIAAAAIIGAIILGAKTYYIHPGNVGVLIEKAGQTGNGVSETPIRPGWGFRHLFTEEVQEYPTFVQTAVWTKSNSEGHDNDESITANTQEGLAVNLDVSVSYTLDAGKVPDLYVKFRQDIGTIQEVYMRQTVRQAVQDVFGGYSVDDIYGPKKQEVVSKIQAAAVAKLSPDGFTVTQFTVNEIRLPQNIVDSIQNKIVAAQKVQTAQQDLERIKVEAEQTTTKATAEANAIKIQAEAITQQGGDAYVQLQAVNKWNGVMPTYVTSGAVLPFINASK